MEMNEYQVIAGSTAIYPGRKTDLGLFYTSLGLVNEAGEVAGKVKKYIRDGDYDDTQIADELSDVLWYIAMVADEIGWPLEEIAARNVAKLKSRFERGVLQGSGDNR
jgi:NTP pyrophosphatase (non-canonical NTP hydrolase)